MVCDVVGTLADAMTKSAGTGRDLMATLELVCLLRVVTNAITCDWGNASLDSYKFAVRLPVVLEWRELRRTIALKGTRSREVRGMQ